MGDWTSQNGTKRDGRNNQEQQQEKKATYKTAAELAVKKLIMPILFLYYEKIVCPLLLNYNKVYFASLLIAKPNTDGNARFSSIFEFEFFVHGPHPIHHLSIKSRFLHRHKGCNLLCGVPKKREGQNTTP